MRQRGRELVMSAAEWEKWRLLAGWTGTRDRFVLSEADVTAERRGTKKGIGKTEGKGMIDGDRRRRVRSAPVGDDVE